VRGAGPLAVNDFVKVIRIFSIGLFQRILLKGDGREKAQRIQFVALHDHEMGEGVEVGHHGVFHRGGGTQ
jgi:hypothetical protein